MSESHTFEGTLDKFDMALTKTSKDYFKVGINGKSFSWFVTEGMSTEKIISEFKLGDRVLVNFTTSTDGVKTYNNISSMVKTKIIIQDNTPAVSYSQQYANRDRWIARQNSMTQANSLLALKYKNTDMNGIKFEDLKKEFFEVAVECEEHVFEDRGEEY